MPAQSWSKIVKLGSLDERRATRKAVMFQVYVIVSLDCLNK